jgi:tricorn protease
VFAIDGRWITEGKGIAPHIEIDNLPHATHTGEDAQLKAAIKLLEEKLENDPIPELKPEAFPPVQEAANDITLN